MNRREFMISVARVGVLSAISVGAVLGFRSKKITTKAKGACPVNPSCAQCGEYSKCIKEIKQEQQAAIIDKD